MNRQPVRIVGECSQQEFERGCVLLVNGEVARERESRSPILGVLCNGVFTVLGEFHGCAKRGVAPLQTLEDKRCAMGERARELLPGVDGSAHVALLLAEIAEGEVGGSRALVDVDGLGEGAAGFAQVSGTTLRFADLMVQETHDFAIVRVGCG